MTTRHVSRIAVALGAWIAVLHVRVLFGGMSFALRDHLVLGLPIRTFLGASLREGRIPQWWDGIGAGVPFAASPVHQAFAPLTWVCALLPMPLGADLEPLVYLFVAALGTALLSARLGAGCMGAFLAGGVVATSGYLNSLVVNGNVPHVAWLPWVAWGTVRLVDEVGASRPVRAAALLSFVSALHVVGGEPAALVTAALVVVAVAWARGSSPRTVAWLAASGVGAIALAAVQLLPAALLVGSTDRAGGFDLATAGQWSLHPVRLLELVWPRLAGDPLRPEIDMARLFDPAGAAGQDPTWAYSIFLGAPVLVLAVAGARGRLRLLLVAGVLLLVALGTHTPAFGLLRTIFPPERYARFPEKHVLGVVVLAAALAGAALAELRARPRRWAVALGAAAGVLALALLALAAGRSGLAASLSARAAAAGMADLQIAAALGVTLRWGAVAVLALVASAAATVLLARSRTRLAGELLLVAAVALPAGADVRAFTRLVARADVTTPPPLLRLPSDDADVLPRLYRPRVTSEVARTGPETPRVSFETAAINTASRFGFQVIPGHDVALDREWAAFWDDAHRRLSAWDLGTLFGVRWVIVDDFAVMPPYPGPVAARARRLSAVDFAAGARPRAYVTSRWAPVRSREEAIATLLAPGRARDPAFVAVEPAAARDGPRRPLEGPARPCIVRQRSPEQVELLCDAPADGYAVLLDAHARGWSATVDGAPVEVARADGFFRAVPVRAGVHRIRFEYSTPGIAQGAWISTLALLAVAASVVAASGSVSRRRSRNGLPPNRGAAA